MDTGDDTIAKENMGQGRARKRKTSEDVMAECFRGWSRSAPRGDWALERMEDRIGWRGKYVFVVEPVSLLRMCYEIVTCREVRYVAGVRR